MSGSRRGRSPESLRWLSQDYAVLREEAAQSVFDAVIVGSGYGGAMAAAELAGRHDTHGRPLRVCVLERGKEYAPGMFASSLQDLPPNLRVNRKGHWKTLGPRDALIDVRLGPDVSTLLGNGLGGTSLINAGVMQEPDLADSGLPPEVVADLTQGCFDEVKAALGASPDLERDHPRLGAGHPLAKTQALREVAKRSGRPFHDAWITVQTKEGDPNVPQCTLCGDCMTGCNVGAKKSLDTTLLAQAWTRGAEIYTGGSVLTVRRDPNTGDWLLKTIFTSESLRERHEAVDVRARKVILAAGALGSTEILLRSQQEGLPLSARVGERFSCNGDNLVAVHAGPEAVHATTDEWQPLAERRVGPTITGVVTLPGLLLEEFAVPAPLKRLFAETVTTAALFHDLARRPRLSAAQEQGGLDSMAVDPDAMERTLLVGIIGHDEAQGRIALTQPAARSRLRARECEGSVHIAWPEIRRSPRMEDAYAAAEQALGAQAGATVLPNPAWRLLPADTEFLLRGERGPVLTVHPLGGCAMGRSHLDGAVNQFGCVFNPRGSPSQPLHEGLVVLDGSIIPGSLGANPALTIAAVARRAARALATQWGWQANTGTHLVQLPPRPVYRPPNDCTPAAPIPTKVEIVERLAGKAGGHWVEWTLFYEPKEVHALTTQSVRALKIDPQRSVMRVYADDPPPPPTGDGHDKACDARARLLSLEDYQRDDLAIYKAQVSGTLTLREPRLGWLIWPRAARATLAWLVNRGFRELWDRYVKRVPGAANLKFSSFVGSATRSAELRCLDYVLDVDRVQWDRGTMAGQLPAGARLTGSKKLTYGLRSNPWRQLTQLTMHGFPGVSQAVLKLDARFLVRQGFPLLRIQQQQNQMVALAELASLGAAWARLLVSIHLWSFRAPDPSPPRVPELLPSAIRGLPEPVIRELDLEPAQWQQPVRVRLTRYPNHAGKPPIVLLHGYSASGNTFTHPSIPHPLAHHFWQDGRDVWVLDLRTSAGMPTATLPWRFEDAALADVPVAIAHIVRETGGPVDVFAHCIGAVMLAMALLADRKLKHYEAAVFPGSTRTPTRYQQELKDLRNNIRRIVLSQKGPTLVYCDDNILRAYFMRALRHALLPDDYQFRVRPDAPLSSQLLDRVLSTMLYPEEEYLRENPMRPCARTPWAGFRHRMDALYARDFSLGNIADGTLSAIEDLFGPLNLDTVAQAIHFARQNTITDGGGRPFDTSIPALARRWPRGGTLSIHGEDNGLVDVKTLEVMKAQMNLAQVPYQARLIPGHGHQDCLIGVHARDAVFGHVSAFLDRP
jgi:cholesterol oxidase